MVVLDPSRPEAGGLERAGKESRAAYPGSREAAARLICPTTSVAGSLCEEARRSGPLRDSVRSQLAIETLIERTLAPIFRLPTLTSLPVGISLVTVAIVDFRPSSRIAILTLAVGPLTRTSR
jgi:hypothetical protein